MPREKGNLRYKLDAESPTAAHQMLAEIIRVHLFGRRGETMSERPSDEQREWMDGVSIRLRKSLLSLKNPDDQTARHIAIVDTLLAMPSPELLAARAEIAEVRAQLHEAQSGCKSAIEALEAERELKRASTETICGLSDLLSESKKEASQLRAEFAEAAASAERFRQAAVANQEESRQLRAENERLQLSVAAYRVADAVRAINATLERK